MAVRTASDAKYGSEDPGGLWLWCGCECGCVSEREREAGRSRHLYLLHTLTAFYLPAGRVPEDFRHPLQAPSLQWLHRQFPRTDRYFSFEPSMPDPLCLMVLPRYMLNRFNDRPLKHVSRALSDLFSRRRHSTLVSDYGSSIRVASAFPLCL